MDSRKIGILMGQVFFYCLLSQISRAPFYLLLLINTYEDQENNMVYNFLVATDSASTVSDGSV